MKAKIIDHEGFKPFDIVLTVESEEEAIELHKLFMDSDIIDLDAFDILDDCLFERGIKT